MGMPIIAPGTDTREQVITDSIESIAMNETALSRILSAESEKMQAVIGMNDVTPDQLMDLSASVEEMISTITKLEMMLKLKLDLFSSEI